MRFIDTYKIFEFKKEDINLITSEKINNYFTVAFEFELETKDKNISKIFTQSDQLKSIKTKLKKNLKNTEIDYKYYESFIDDILNMIDLDDEEITFSEVLIPNMDDENKNKIIEYLIPIISEYFDNNDKEDTEFYKNREKELNYIKSKIEEYLPNFYKEYGDIMKYEYDMTLKKGIEFSPKTYIKGINESLKLLKLFFKDFDEQNYWYMSERTSIHINIGIDNKNTDWNILKGIVFLKDWKDNKSKLPFVFYDVPDRIESNFNMSFIENINKIDEFRGKSIYDTLSSLDFSNVEKIENIFENIFWKMYYKLGDKAFGFNFKNIYKYNYIEFRYIGGNLNYEVMKEKLLYFSYIVYLMTHENYKRKEYSKKLFKLIDYLKNKIKNKNEK